MDDPGPPSGIVSQITDELLLHVNIGISWLLFMGLSYFVLLFVLNHWKSLARILSQNERGSRPPATAAVMTRGGVGNIVGNVGGLRATRTIDVLRRRREDFTFWWMGSNYAVIESIAAIVMSTASTVIFVILTIRVSGVNVKASDFPGEDWDSTEYDAIFEETWLIWTEFVISMFFLGEYFLFFYMAADKLRYIVSMLALINTFTIIPAFVGLVTGFYFYGLEFLRFARILYSIYYLRNIGWPFFSTLPGQLVLVFSVVLSVLFTSTSFIFVAENDIVNEAGKISNFFEAFYFIVVSFTTVGYGDIVATSTLGRGIVVVMIVVGLAILPSQLNRLLTVMRTRHDRSRKWFEGTGHVLVHTHVPQVLDFFSEFYHVNHGRANVQSVLMTPNTEHLPREVEVALSEPQLQYRVFHVVASATNTKDLARVNIAGARHVFLLANRYAADRDEEDARVILEAFAFRKFHPGITMSIQILAEKHVDSLLDAEVQHVLCMNELRMGLLSQAVVCPGFSTYISNLMRSVSLSQLEKVASGHGWPYFGAEMEVLGLPNDYYQGLGKQLYLIRDMSHYAGLTYRETALIFYNKFGVLLIGVTPRPAQDLPIDETISELGALASTALSSMAGVQGLDFESRELIVNPGHGYLMPHPQVGFVYGIAIAGSQEEIREIEAFHQQDLEPKDKATLRRFKQERQSEERIRTLHDTFVRKASIFNVHRGGSLPKPYPRADLRNTRLTQHDLPNDTTNPEALLHENQEFTLDHPTEPTTAVGQHGLVESWHGSRHVLVLGDSATDMVTFVKKVRSYDVKEIKPIVVMTPYGLPSTEASKLAKLPRLYQMKGRSTDMHDCARAGMHFADNVVILGSGSNTDASVDAQSVVAFRLSKRGTTFPIVDLAFAQNAAFLGPLATSNVDYLRNPYYAAGQMFASSGLDTLLCQTYYEFFQLQTVRSLLSGQVFSLHVEDHLKEYADQPMAKLFDTLLHWDLLLLGAYRCHPETPLRYVLCVPEPSSLVYETDILYVLDTSDRTEHRVGQRSRAHRETADPSTPKENNTPTSLNAGTPMTKPERDTDAKRTSDRGGTQSEHAAGASTRGR